ncbi:MAG: O-antigen ligase family protein [Anaerolineales bacterium]|nr:O-antigen ligase family protein [Anaerolineales bacterium]
MTSSLCDYNRWTWIAWGIVFLIASPSIVYLSFIGANWWMSLALLLSLLLATFPPFSLLYKSPVDIPLFLLALLAALSLLITADPDLTLGAVMRLWAGVASFFLLFSFARGRWLVTWFGLGFFMLGILLALASPFLIQWPANKIPFIPTALYNIFPSITADVVHPNTAATMLILFMPVGTALMLGLYEHRSPKIWVLLAALGTVIMGIVFLLTQSRAGYITAAVTILIVLWLMHWRKLFGVALLFTLAGAGMLYLFSTAAEVSDQIATTVNSTTFEFRLQVWKQSVWMIHDFPFTGVGLDAFNAVAERLYPFPHFEDPGAHNLYLHIAAEMGLIALIAYLSIVGVSLWMGFKQIRSATAANDYLLNALTVGSLCGWIGLHLHGFLDNTLWATRIAFLPWVLLALILTLANYTEEKINHDYHNDFPT